MLIQMNIFGHGKVEELEKLYKLDIETILKDQNEKGIEYGKTDIKVL